MTPCHPWEGLFFSLAVVGEYSQYNVPFLVLHRLQGRFALLVVPSIIPVVDLILVQVIVQRTTSSWRLQRVELE